MKPLIILYLSIQAALSKDSMQKCKSGNMLENINEESLMLKMAMGKMCPPCKNILTGPMAGSYKLESAIESACNDGCRYSKDGVFFCFAQEEKSSEEIEGYPTQECGKFTNNLIEKYMKALNPDQESISEESYEEGAKTTSCCPSDAWGQLDQEGYEPKGSIERVGDLDMYRVGKGEKCIIWNYDIFGLNSGRTKQTADLFSEFGYMVIIPDYFGNGSSIIPWYPNATELIKEQSDWTNLEKTWKEIIFPYAESNGAKKFGVLGTCWGTYLVMRLSSDPKVSAGISWHPSHTQISRNLGEDPLELMRAVQCPQLIMPAASDPVEDKTGGVHVNILEENAGVEVVEFPEMQHGWTVRGNMSEANVKNDVLKAIKLSLEFFERYL